MIAGKAGENDSHLLATLDNMKVLGRSFEEFDQWADAAGCTCHRRPRWDNPPSGNPTSTPGWAIVNLAAKYYGFEYRNGHKAHGVKSAGNGRGNGKTNSNGSVSHSPPPAPGWDGLTPVYQVAWLAHVAHDALVVVWDPEAHERDGAISYTLYAVDEETGRLECGPLMTGHRIAAAQAYRGACLHLGNGDQSAVGSRVAFQAPPAPGWDGLTPVYQGWRPRRTRRPRRGLGPEAHERDGAISYTPLRRGRGNRAARMRSTHDRPPDRGRTGLPGGLPTPRRVRVRVRRVRQARPLHACRQGRSHHGRKYGLVVRPLPQGLERHSVPHAAGARRRPDRDLDAGWRLVHPRTPLPVGRRGPAETVLRNHSLGL